MADPTFAFLRAVNLGKHNKVPMRELVNLLEAEGLGPVAFMLASGNLVFPEPVRTDLGERLKALIHAHFGVDTDLILRDAASLRSLVAANPFGVPQEGSVQISIWDGQPDADGLALLAGTDHKPDELHLVEGAAIIRYASSSHDSKLSNNLIIRRLGVPATLRNVKTFIRLLGKFA